MSLRQRANFSTTTMEAHTECAKLMRDKCQHRFLNSINYIWEPRWKILKKLLPTDTHKKTNKKTYNLGIRTMIQEGKSEMQEEIYFCLNSHFWIYHLIFTLIKTPDWKES